MLLGKDCRAGQMARQEPRPVAPSSNFCFYTPLSRLLSKLEEIREAEM